jgi:hypothetical protein
MNFADESACLTADNIQNEVVTSHRSQEVLKMLSSVHKVLFTINCFVKNTGTEIFLAFSTPDANFLWMASAVALPFLH